MPIKDSKTILISWVKTDKIHDISVQQSQNFLKMKSHGCHVVMQLLLPCAFAELLPTTVHEALAGK